MNDAHEALKVVTSGRAAHVSTQAVTHDPLEMTVARLEALVHRLRAEAPKAPESRPVFRLLEGGLNQAPREAPRKAQKVGPEGPAFCRARETAPGLSQPV